MLVDALTDSFGLRFPANFMRNFIIFKYTLISDEIVEELRLSI